MGQSQFTIWDEEFGATGHECQVCFDGVEATPMMVAYRVLNIPPHLRRQMMAEVHNGTTLFSLGWESGVEGHETTSPFDRKMSAISPGLFTHQGKAWLAGYVAGRYASSNGWKSASCRLNGPEEHNISDLDRYMKMVENAGRFPQDSLLSDPIARGILQAAMDGEATVHAGARLIKVAIEHYMVAIKTTVPGFDPDPTVVGGSNETIYAKYILYLDKNVPGWFWTRTSRMPGELAKAAVERRRQAVCENDYQGS